MALIRGSFDTSASNGRYLTFAWEQTSSDYAANTSQIYWELRGAGDSGWVICGNFKVTLDNQVVYQSATRINVYPGTLIANGTYTYHHAADGTGFTACSVEAGIYQYAVNCTGFSWMDLVDIPRASSITSAGNITLGGKCSITWTPAAAGFRYKIRFSLGTWNATTWYISPNTTSAYTYTEYTIPENVAAQIPNSTEGTMAATLYTYNSSGDNAIGSASKTFTVTVPIGIVPTVAAPTVTEATPGLASKFAAFVQNKSKLNIVSSPAGAQGSTITECKVTVDGQTYSGTTVTTSPITASGTVKITVTVKDSRGRTAAATKYVTVVAYSPPSITAFSAIRCDANGVLNTGGTNLKVTMNFAISAVGNKNDKSYVVKVREQVGTTWTTLASGTVYSYNGSFVATTFTAQATKSYVVRLELSDYFVSAYASETDVGSSFRLMNYAADGKGIAFGKFSEGPEFDVGMPAKFRKSVTLGNSVTDVHQINGALVMKNHNIYVSNGCSYFSRSNADSGTKDMFLIGCNSHNNTIVGYGGYSNEIGETHIMGKVIRLISKNTDGVYINGYWPICGKYANGYAGMLVNTTDDQSWIRTTSKGIIPYQEGGNSSNIGTKYWPFKGVYTQSLIFPGGNPVGNTIAGNIGINSSDSYRLEMHMSNGITFRPDNNSGNGNISVVGSIVYTASCFQYSSKRFKENIIDITNEDANKLLSLNPVTFDYIDTHISSSGLIAEDTEPYFPELVMYDKNKITGLNYIGLIPYIIKKIQMQQEEIETIKRNAE